jgi:nucleotide-binding universal stress UspA family protein
MFKKILVPVDGSADSLKALKFAESMTEKLGSEVVLLHVSELNPYQLMYDTVISPLPWLNEAASMLEAHAKEVIEKAKSHVPALANKLQVKTMIGNPGEIIPQVAEENGCDLILMGTRGLSDLKGLIMGSVSHRVLQRSKVPVLIVNVHTRLPDESFIKAKDRQ